MLKKGGHSHYHYWYDPITYLLVAIPILIINGYIFGLKYIKKEETKTKGILMITGATIVAIIYLLFIVAYLYSVMNN